jgi:hypothetical protein
MNFKDAMAFLNNIEDVNLKAYVKDVNDDYPIKVIFAAGEESCSGSSSIIYLNFELSEENSINVEDLKKEINNLKKIPKENATIEIKLSKKDGVYYDIRDIKRDILIMGKVEKCLVFFITKREMR